MARCCSDWFTGYLPFMVLPLYATLERLDRTLLEAAADWAHARGHARLAW